MIQLRNYQTEAIDNLTTAAANGSRRLLLQAPTGAGKTVIFAEIIKNAVKNGFRVLVLCHRREIIFQTVKKINDCGIEAGVIMAEELYDKSMAVQVASIPSLYSWACKRKVESFPPAEIVIQDECHHAGSRTWTEIVESYPNAIILGASATPITTVGGGLGEHFDILVKCPSIAELTRMGFLVPVRYFCPSIPDLQGLRIVAGDYVEKHLEERMDKIKLIGDIVENWVRFGEDRQTIVSASGVKHSIHIAEAFNKIGVPAAHIDGETAKDVRDKILQEFTKGTIRVVSQCAVLSEGTDIPPASCLILARPTKSLRFYLQVAGRVLRPFPGKANTKILDHGGVIYEHGPIDQDWDWSLDYPKNSDIRQATERRQKLKKEIVCDNCKCAYWGKLACPECGWVPKIAGKSIESYPGYLQALDEIENPPLANKETWYRMLMGYALERNKKPGLAYFKFLDRWGEKPAWAWRNLPPLTPNKEVLAWLDKERRTWWWKKNNNELAERLEARQNQGHRIGAQPA